MRQMTEMSQRKKNNRIEQDLLQNYGIYRGRQNVAANRIISERLLRD